MTSLMAMIPLTAGVCLLAAALTGVTGKDQTITIDGTAGGRLPQGRMD